MPFLKRILKITGSILLAILLMLLVSVLLIQTEWAQNFVIGKVTKRLSKDLNTEVSIKRIRLGFFDKLLLEGTLVRDQQKDTLLYAGRLKVDITDWFFMKNDIELKYIGLENAVVNMHRVDSVWNYQFIIDSLAPAQPQKKQTKSDIQLYLKTLDLENVYFKYRDEWVGQDMVGSIGSLELTAEEFNITRKKIFINSLTIDRPSFYSYDYQGKKPNGPKKKKPIVSVKNDSLEWNTEGWDILVNKFSIREGELSFERQSDKKKLEHFDPDHIYFTGITGTIQQFSVTNDTLSGKIDLKANERSGLTVNRLKANMKFHPRGMIFSDLDIQTPNSRLRDYYAMRYEEFNRDMNGFLSNVRIEASFLNSQVSTKDIAYFAPELKNLNKTITISGKARGTVEDFTATNIRAKYGNSTSLTGNLTMKGLPDINKTFIEFSSGSFKSTYAEVVGIAPDIRKIKQPDLASLQYIQFDGSFAGYINNFYILPHQSWSTNLKMLSVF